MRRSAAALASLAVLSGCLGPEGSLQEDGTQFHAAGAFEAALAAGASVLGAREDPGDAGRRYASVPLAVQELDEAWGAGRYALEAIHWWGPSGAPPPGPSGGSVVVMDGAEWQGFLLDASQLQVIPGAVDPDKVRELADEFLQNVTTLPPAQRDAVVADLMSACDVLACTTQGVSGVDAAAAWTKRGGLPAVTHDGLQAGHGILALDSWWFRFAFDVATLEDGSGEGRIFLEVGSNDVVAFSWQSSRSHDDDASYGRLEEALEGIGVQVPEAHRLAWVHQSAGAE